MNTAVTADDCAAQSRAGPPVLYRDAAAIQDGAEGQPWVVGSGNQARTSRIFVSQ